MPHHNPYAIVAAQGTVPLIEVFRAAESSIADANRGEPRALDARRFRTAAPARFCSRSSRKGIAMKPASTGSIAKTRFWSMALLLIGGSMATEASAQLVVNDPVNLTAHMQQIAEDAVEFGKEAKRWNDTYSHYQQQLIKLQRLNFDSPQMADTFPLRPDDYGLQDMCPAGGEGGGVRERMTGLLRQIAPKMDGNIVEEQKAICQRMVLAENAKYNESVRMLKTLIQRNQQFQQIEAQRDGASSNQGALAANDNEAQRFMVRTSMDLDYWQARMKAYNDYIESLKWDQSRLAKRALQGNRGSLLGQVVQAAALKAALSK
ncbi:hypothetical protein LA76x_5116 [Lysobacter antibioticus]|uniref:Uncharacterized protein n=1 Tax=Lysobacter antibioticus TaxID=84531 RepID=A0A0S2FIC1_LYSAN|nr:hypothetical protein LA76x_5116 [Lysobacter antibioticus]